MSAFCDFLAIYQQHDPRTTRELNAGRVVKLKATPEDKADGSTQTVMSIIDEDGVVVCDGFLEFTTAQSIKHEGSFETSVQIKSEGGRVMLSGNIGRFCRADNVWGYSVYECVQLANRALSSLGLPPFTWGERNGNRQGKDASIRMDAIITGVHLTKNYVTGSPENLARLLHYIAGMHVGSKPGKSYDTGVTWGERSKWWYAKLYDKYADIVKSEHVPLHLVSWVQNAGLARFEVSLKTRYLTQHGLNYVGVWEDPTMGDVVYGRFAKPLSKCEVSVDSFEEIPGRAGELAVMWRNGTDLKARLATATYYRYRKLLLDRYGIDISERCDVSRLPMRFEVVTLAEASPPEWYQLPPLAA